MCSDLLTKPYSRVGLYETDPQFQEGDITITYSTASIILEIIVTCIIMGLIVPAAVVLSSRKGIAAGEIRPINSVDLQWFAMCGSNMPHTWPLALYTSCMCLLVLGGITSLITYAVCANGGFPVSAQTGHCYCSTQYFYIFKSLWAAVLIMILFPIVFLSSLNHDSVAAYAYLQSELEQQSNNNNNNVEQETSYQQTGHV
jgi:hypothetical protein